ncbi:MAG: macro domain-containing protein [Pseudomonadales bacterium]|nr:macro domain-containing protein [Pseudomonadales bacterium]
MITYTQGNLLDSPAEALVNTVNTVGVMGKGIALMFKERFEKNMLDYAKACKNGEVVTGTMFVTETGELMGPKWIVNFPTKRHWRTKSKIEWVIDGLHYLRRFILENQVSSIAVPPLGAGNGGLKWSEVKPHVEEILGDLNGVEVIVFEPTVKYQNVAKKEGVEQLTPARALIAELVRRYWVLGMECSILEIQKLAWFLQRSILATSKDDPLRLRFEAHFYGPYSNNLVHLINALDGSYLSSDKRIPDAEPLDVIWFNDKNKDRIAAYLNSEAQDYIDVLDRTTQLIDGFESPYGMELLSTVDWLIQKEHCEPTVEAIEEGILKWPAGEHWAKRKAALFERKHIKIALDRLQQFSL